MIEKTKDTLLLKCTFDELPTTQKRIEIDAGNSQMAEIFEGEEAHKGLTEKDYEEDTISYLKDKFNGEEKENFYYKIHRKGYFIYKGKTYNVDKIIWMEGEYYFEDTIDEEF